MSTSLSTDDVARRIDEVARRTGQPPDVILSALLESLEQQAAELPFRHALESSILSCIIVDGQTPRQPIVYVNPAFEKITGYTAAEVMGRNAAFLEGGDHDQAGLHALRKALANGESLNVRLRNYRKDGTLFWNDLHVHPLHGPDGRLTHFVQFQRDITQQVEHEKELHTSRARLRGILDSQIDFVCRYTPDTRLSYVNEAYCQHFGKTREQLIGLSFLELVSESQHPAILARIAEVLRDPSSQVRIFESNSVNGRVNWIQWIDYGITDHTGQVIEIQAVGRNITPLLETQTRLAEREETLNTILRSIPVMLAQFDAAGQFEYVNKYWVDVLGWTVEAMREHPDILSEFYPDPAYRQQALDYMLSAEPGWRDFQTRSKDGRYIETSWSNVRLADGRSIGIGIDITQRKAMEKALRESEEQYRSLVEASHDLIWSIDADGLITFVNQAALHIYGREPDEIIGQPYMSFMPPDEVEARRTALPPANDRVTDVEIWVVHRDGHRVLLNTNAVVIRDENGQITGITGISQDMTHRRELENQRLYTHQLEAELKKERELRALKDHFVSLVSHEFRGPLAVMTTSIDFVTHYFERLSRERMVEKLDIIQEQIHRMVTLMEDTLRFSKGAAGKIELHPQAVDLLPFFQKLIDTFGTTDHDQHMIVLRGDPGIIQADPRLLDHIFSNLITNALKYSPVGSTVTITILRHADSWEIRVADEGIGIPPTELPSLFEPFYRASNARDFPGTGLGLSIVRDYATTHNGRIEVESTLGSGTTFVIMLPVLTGGAVSAL